MRKINREAILSYFLGFVVLWFGIEEVMHPANWTIFVPQFFGTGDTLTYLVIFHGVLLLACGLSLIFNFHRRVAAVVFSLMLLEIIINLFLVDGLSEIVVRDIGLLGMAITLTF